jgi:hypothetical protein
VCKHAFKACSPHMLTSRRTLLCAVLLAAGSSVPRVRLRLRCDVVGCCVVLRAAVLGSAQAFDALLPEGAWAVGSLVSGSALVGVVVGCVGWDDVG